MSLTSENNVQAELVKDINKAGGYAFKASNSLTTGVPDLSITPPPFGYNGLLHIKMEVKFKKVTAKTRGLTMSLSVPQRTHLEKTTVANGIGCWIAAYNFTDRQQWGLFILHHRFGDSFKVTQEAMNDPTSRGHFPKIKGRPWNVVSMCELICRAEIYGNYDHYANCNQL